MPIIDVLRTYPKNVALGVGSRIGIDAAFYILAVYSLTHISANLGLSPNIGLLAVSIAALIEIFTIPAFASLSDRVGRRPILIGGAALLGIWAFPFFGLLNTKSTVLIILATIVGLSVAHAAFTASRAASTPSSSAHESATVEPPSATRSRASSEALWRRSSPPGSTPRVGRP
jgi:MFS transporter, MHS family, shikimate and dehydroshikimate transport protein